MAIQALKHSALTIIAVPVLLPVIRFRIGIIQLFVQVRQLPSRWDDRIRLVKRHCWSEPLMEHRHHLRRWVSSSQLATRRESVLIASG